MQSGRTGGDFLPILSLEPHLNLSEGIEIHQKQLCSAHICSQHLRS